MAARRAARLGLNFQAQVSDRDLAEHYRDECRRAGRESGLVLRPPQGPAYASCALRCAAGVPEEPSWESLRPLCGTVTPAVQPARHLRGGAGHAQRVNGTASCYGPAGWAP